MMLTLRHVLILFRSKVYEELRKLQVFVFNLRQLSSNCVVNDISVKDRHSVKDKIHKFEHFYCLFKLSLHMNQDINSRFYVYCLFFVTVVFRMC